MIEGVAKLVGWVPEGNVKIEWVDGKVGTTIRAIQITTQELEAIGAEMLDVFNALPVEEGFMSQGWAKVAHAGLSRAFPMLIVEEIHTKAIEEAEVVEEESVKELDS